MGTLEGLRANGLSILLTTHNMDEASHLCDRLIIIDHGKILVQGKPSSLVKEYAGRDVLEILNPSEELRAFVRSEPYTHDILEHRIIIYGRKENSSLKRLEDASVGRIVLCGWQRWKTFFCA